MAQKRQYIGDSSINYNTGSSYISNGEVTPNATTQGVPGSRGTTSSSSSSSRPRTSGGSSGGSSGGYSSSSSSSNGYDTAAAYNALLAAYRQNDYSDYLAQRQAAAQRAYDRSMSALNDAYNSQVSSLNDNLASTKGQLSSQYNYSKNNINRDAEKSLRQAYINKVLSEKNLNQQMSALGLSGGATETTLAKMLNNYGNARNNINNTMADNLASLENTYQSGLAQAMQAYNSALANANAQKANQTMTLENALSNNEIAALGDYQSLMQQQNAQYLDLLKSAIANGAKFSYTPTEATNDVQAMAFQQTANPTLATNYAALQELMGQNLPGTTKPGVTVLNTNSGANDLASILAQLYANRG